MKEKLGVYGIIAILAAYSVIHWVYVSSTELAVVESISYHVGALSVICMAMTIVISVRPTLVEDYFGGLDRMYQVHKWLGIAALALFMVHFATSVGGSEEDTILGIEIEEEGGEFVSAVGMFSMLGFIILIILTLNRKFPYHIWIKTHLLTGLFFALACLHVALVFRDGVTIPFLSAPGLLIAFALISGALGYIYKQTLYRRTERKSFVLDEVNPLERATEVVLKPQDKPLEFEPGQFAFLKIREKGFSEYHPFTISSGNSDNSLRFTMKVLGDYTRRVRDKLSAGAEALVEGPYGRFNPLKGPAKQVWLAGGIGITPFLSTLRSMKANHGHEVHLFYCVREREEAIYLEEMEEIARAVGGVQLHLITSNDGGRLTADRIEEHVDSAPADYAYYFCGPRPMLNALTSGLEAKGVSKGAIHFEEFEMR